MILALAEKGKGDMILTFLREKKVQCGSGEVIRVDKNEQFSELAMLIIDGVHFDKINFPQLAWHEGPRLYKRTHFHADLSIEDQRLHLDYFKVIGSDSSHEGFIFSRDDEILCVGGNWSGKYGVGSRNWPLGLRLGAIVLTAFTPTWDGGLVDISRSVALWKMKLDQPMAHSLPPLTTAEHSEQDRAVQVQQARKVKSIYPKPFQTEWQDDGSRTIGNGHRFFVTVDQNGFAITKKHGKWSRDDLFGELGYWPETVIWSNESETLGDLLMQLAKTTQASPQKLLAAIKLEFEEYNELGISAYLKAEKRALRDKGDLAQLREEWVILKGSHQIPAIPSPNNSWGDGIDGLELDFDSEGWTARLFSDSNNSPEIFIPETRNSETFNGLFEATDDSGEDEEDSDENEEGSEEDADDSGEETEDSGDDADDLGDLPFTRDELAELLIKDDRRWRRFIESEKARGST